MKWFDSLIIRNILRIHIPISREQIIELANNYKI